MTTKPIRTKYGHVPNGGPCPTCGKRRFPTRADAKKVAKRMHESSMGVYRCGVYYHLGHLPDPVVQGKIPREALSRPNRGDLA
jgi:hypothetical protein